MARKYYTLLAREHGLWVIEFGDYDKEVVQAERDEYRYIGRAARDLKIITTPDAKQKTINAVVAKFNEGK